jgi:hypothetical protein
VQSDADTTTSHSGEQGDRLIERFKDGSNPDLIEREVAALVDQRVLAQAFGYPDTNGHNQCAMTPCSPRWQSGGEGQTLRCPRRQEHPQPARALPRDDGGRL